MKAFTIALATAALVAGPSLISSAPAFAQAAQPAAERKFDLSKAERAAIDPLLTATNAAIDAQKAGQAPNWAAVRTLLPAAEAAAKGNDARYFVARSQLSLAVGANDFAAQERALAILLANPATTAEERTAYAQARAGLAEKRAEQAFAANDFATAERLYTDLLKANPGEARLQNNLRIVQQRSGNTAGALQSTLEQIRAAEAGGGRAAEALYRTVFETQYRAQQRAQAVGALATLIRNYPTTANVQTGLSMLREGADGPLLVDALRFARAAGALQSNQYQALATELNYAGLPGETLAVIDAGIAAGAMTPASAATMRATAQRRIAEDRAGLTSQIAQAKSAARGRSARIVADALYGYGRFGEAAELYRVALAKGGEDASLINTRLGAALALAGDRAGAEAAFLAVTGRRSELAQMWLAWLFRRTG